MNPLLLLLPLGLGGAGAWWWWRNQGDDPKESIDMDDAVKKLAAAGPQYCTNLAAAWVMAELGKIPVADLDNWKSWYEVDPDLWATLSLWEDRADPRWGNVKKVASLFKTGPIFTVAGAARPTLTTGVWYFVQRWNGYPHSYIVQRQSNGKYRIIQTSETHGFRDTIEDSYVSSSYDVGVAAMS